jgi:catechol-2,3-dioxygenase
MHHHAYVVRDQEQTRHFYEDIIGLPLRATWIESNEFEGETLVCSHTFYGLGDGGALAFFNFPDRKMHDKYYSSAPNIFYHIALLVDAGMQEEIYARCKAAGAHAFMFDHGYCKSLYVTDPDGLHLEFTVDAADVNEINAQQAATARRSLDAWQAGDRTPNNHVRPHGALHTS